MAKKKFKVDIFSPSSVSRAIKELRGYQNDLTSKTRLLVKMLADKGITVARARINESPLGKYVSVTTNLSDLQMGTKAILVAVGEVKVSDEYADFNTLLAIEFGAGIYYNKSPNPKSSELGYGPGTFPGQIHAFDDGWYYWDEEEQRWRYTHGVRATMPMHLASLEIIREITNVAKTVFK